MRQKLLIADDEPGIVDMMKSYFSPDYDVLTAYSGEEAVSKTALKPDPIDITLLVFSESFALSTAEHPKKFVKVLIHSAQI